MREGVEGPGCEQPLPDAKPRSCEDAKCPIDEPGSTCRADLLTRELSETPTPRKGEVLGFGVEARPRVLAPSHGVATGGRKRRLDSGRGT